MKVYKKNVFKNCQDLNEVYLKINEIKDFEFKVSSCLENDKIIIDICSRNGIMAIKGDIKKNENGIFEFSYARKKGIFDTLSLALVIIGIINSFFLIIFFTDDIFRFFFMLFAALYASFIFYCLANMSVLRIEKLIESKMVFI